MTHTLTLQLPENLYEPLIKAASQSGQTPEEFVMQWRSNAVQQFADDPIEQFIGAFSSNTPDWADRHDDYLGQEALNWVVPKTPTRTLMPDLFADTSGWGNITEALTTDHHFEQAGLIRLLKIP